MGIFFKWEEHFFSHFTENFEELPSSQNYILNMLRSIKCMWVFQI